MWSPNHDNNDMQKTHRFPVGASMFSTIFVDSSVVKATLRKHLIYATFIFERSLTRLLNAFFNWIANPR